MKSKVWLSVLGAFAVALVPGSSSLSAATHYVSLDSPNPTPPFTTRDTAATNIQDAVDLAMDGDTVLVGDGVYRVGNREISMLNEWAPPPHIVSSGPARVVITRPIRLESVNGPALTTIEGEQYLAEWGVATNGIRCVILGTNATVSGFTLTHGGTFQDQYEAREGGGVWCASTNAVLTNCTVTSNSAWRGGGVRGGTLYNCTVTGNSAQHGAGTQDGVLYDCVLTGNRATGCGGGACGGVLYNCVLKDNSAGGGGGAYTATLTRCTITGNSASDEGGGTWGSILYGCVLSGNSARSGGGAYHGDLVNCTVTLNTAPVGGGTSSARLRNCIVYFNRASGGGNVFGGSCEYSCTTPLPSGPGNISLDPQLTTASHLALTSPCIGAGFVGFATGVDIDGEPWADPPAIGTDQPGPVAGPLAVWIEAGHTNVATGCEVSFIVGNAGEMNRNVWDFGDATGLTNALVARHAWLSPGVYTVRLTGYNDSHPEGVTATTTVLVREPARLYVNADSPNPSPPFSSWETAARIIQDAVDAAQVGDTVLVTNGVYAVGGRETLDDDGFAVGSSARVVITKPITLQSVNGPGVTAIEGSRIPTTVGRDPWGGIRCVFLGNNAVLSGFTLTNGTATRANGAGVFCEPEGVVTNCILTGNIAGSWSAEGGGAYGGSLYNCNLNDNEGSGAIDSTLYDCTLIRNDGWFGGAGGCELHNCTLSENGGGSETGGGANLSILYNCTLTGNKGATGGGAYWSTLFDCVVEGNTAPNGVGGGVCRCVLFNCIVRDNVAGRHGGGAWESILYNCVITGNSARYGGGDALSTLFSCTLTGNSALEYGGGVCDGSTLHNCIVYYNTAPNGANYSASTCKLSDCCTTPLPEDGDGNITGPPLFIDMAAADFRLREESPCIDAGRSLVGFVAINWREEPAPYSHTSTDFLGNTRFIDGNGDGIEAWDMGAYEFIPESLAQVVDIPDPGLLAAIRVALNNPTGDLTVADLESLTELDASRQARGPNAPLIQSLQGLQAAQNLVRLDLSGLGGPEATPNLALNDFSALAGLGNLTELQLADNGLTQLTLPEGLANLRYLNVLGNPITYLAVPKSMDLTQLVIEGFPIERVTVLLRIGPAMVEADGKIRLPIEGMCGQRVKLQRSENLVDWEDWQTIILGGDGCGIIDDPGAIRQRFYRAVEDKLTPLNAP